MAITNFPGGVSSFGFPAMPDYGIPPGGNVYFLDPAHGSDGYDGKTPDRAFATLPTAYAALTANQNDVLFYIAGSSSINLSAQVVWAKNYTHFIGLCSPTMVGQRARIFQAAGDLNLSPLVQITANGCIFANLYIFQGTDDAQSLLDVQVTGQRNFFHNIHFAGGGHATNAIDGCASLNLAGTAMENVFLSCTIGLDTINAAAGVASLLIDGTGCGRNIFRNCHFTMNAGNNGARFVELSGNSALDRYTIFDNCLFLNTNTSLLSAFVIGAGFDPANKRFILKDCVGLGFAKWDADDRGAVYGNMNAVTGADLSGVLVEIHT